LVHESSIEPPSRSQRGTEPHKYLHHILVFGHGEVRSVHASEANSLTEDVDLEFLGCRLESPGSEIRFSSA
jgi:hypothetical protein